MRGNRTKITLFILLTAIFIAADFNLYRNDIFYVSNSLLRYGLVFLSAFIIFFGYELPTLKNGKVSFPKVNALLASVWIMLVLSVILSEIVHLKVPVDGLILLFFTYPIFIVLIPFIINRQLVLYLKAIAFSGILVTILSGVHGFYNNFSFTGISLNPNSYAVILLPSSIATIILLLSDLHKKKRTKFMYLIIFILFLYQIVLTNSRTVLMTIITILAISIIYKFELSKKKVIKNIFLVIISSTIFMYIFHVVTNKNLSRIEDSSLFANREVIWLNILKNGVKIFGFGSYENFDLLAHNSFLQILILYGLITMTVYIILTIIVIIMGSASFLYNKRNREDIIRITPILFTIAFLLVSQTEDTFGIIGKSLTVIYYNSIGLISLDIWQHQSKRNI